MIKKLLLFICLSTFGLKANNMPSCQISANFAGALHSDGSSLCTWLSLGATGSQIEAVSFNGDSWSEKIELEETGFYGQPAVAVNNNGSFIVMWEALEGSETVIHACKLNSGSWSEIATISFPSSVPKDGTPVTVYDPINDITILWNYRSLASLQEYQANHPLLPKIFGINFWFMKFGL